MTKRESLPGASDLSRYRLAWAPRGRGSKGPPTALPGAHAGAIVRVWSPLVDFTWDGGECPLSDGMRIVPAPSDLIWDDPGSRYVLSEEERETARASHHWLELDQPAHDTTSGSAKINAFLIALWVVRPSLTHVSVRFEKGPDGLRVVRVLERFQWIKDQLHPDIRDEDLASVRATLPALLQVYEERGRLRNALSLTFRGCISKDWQSSFVCFSAALEGLLGCGDPVDIPKNLSIAYEKLIGRYGSTTNVDREEFTRLYRVRSEIVHGRAYLRESSTANLEDLTGCSNVLRAVWRVVLHYDEVRRQLEQDDSGRRSLFAAL